MFLLGKKEGFKSICFLLKENFKRVNKPKASRRKEIVKIRPEISEIENRRVRKTRKPKCGYLKRSVGCLGGSVN